MRHAIRLVALLAVLSCGESLAPLSRAGFSVITTGGAHTCGLVADGRAFCWGSNALGQLGSNGPSASLPIPANPGPIALRDLAAGTSFSCGLLRSGEALCWGQGEVPARITDPAQRYSSLSLGEFACGITAGGQIRCWTAPGGAAATVEGGPYFGLDVGFASACALAVADSTGFCWLSGLTEVTPAPGGLQFSQIAVGQNHVCGLLLDATIRCWGGNTLGQLGNNSTSASPVPVSVQRIVPPETPYTAVIAGQAHSCAVDDSGKAWCWGSDGNAQLGYGGGQGTYLPVAIGVDAPGGGATWVRLFAGGNHNCGFASDGLAYCWGANGDGQLGIGTYVDRGAPSPIVLGQ
jgi:hypothetical protein